MSGPPTGPSRPDDGVIGPTAARRSSRKSSFSTGLVVGLGVALLVVGMGGGYALGTYYGGSRTGCWQTTVSETGSSLIYPYLQILAPSFTSAYSGVCFSPISSGSGTGISSAEAGTVDLGGTDAYLDPANASHYHLVNVPIAISAQLVVYNLPGITSHLNLNGTVLARIYQGDLTSWNDPAIAAANPHVSLPSATIKPIHRFDGSGDTFMFTSLCYMSWSGWTAGYGTTVTWPSGQASATGNAGMLTTLNSTPYGIAYIGISYLHQIGADTNLEYAALGDNNANYNGTVSAGGAGQSNYVLPTPQTLAEDANLSLQHLEPPSVAISLILGGVAGATDLHRGQGGTNATVDYPAPYPDTNLEYLLINTEPSSTSHQKWVVAFLEWALTYGGTYAPQAYFLPLPPTIVGYDMLALGQVPVG